MAHSTEDLARIGVDLTTRKLVEQADVSSRLAKDEAAPLGATFPEARRLQIDSLRAQIADSASGQSAAVADVPTLTAGQGAAFADGKEWLRDVADAAATAFEGQPRVDAYHPGGKIGRSVPRLAERLANLAKLAREDAAALAAEGFPETEIARGEAIAARLTEADGSQEAALKKLPAGWRGLAAKKGELLLLLKALERAGRRVFRKDPARAAKFRLTILKRAGHAHATPAAPGTPATPA